MQNNQLCCRFISADHLSWNDHECFELVTTVLYEGGLPWIFYTGNGYLLDLRSCENTNTAPVVALRDKGFSVGFCRLVRHLISQDNAQLIYIDPVAPVVDGFETFDY